MKKIKLIFASLLIVTTLLSCEDDGGDSNRNLTTAAVPDVQKAADTDAYIDFDAIQNGNEISITFNVGVGIENDRGNIQSMDVIGFYITAGGELEKVTLQENVTTFPTSITLSKQDLINTFSALNSDSDFALGDQFIATAEITLTNGQVIQLLTDDASQNYSTYIDPSQASYSVFQVYNVACPSDLGGNYTVISSGSSTDPGPSPSENPISNFASTAVITDNGGGSYSINDAYGGLYVLWYDIYGVTASMTGGVFSDVCGTLSGSFGEPFGTTVTLTGTVNDDGTLSIHWVNGFGDMGDSVYTRVP